MLHGVHTALVTPFDTDGALDLAAYERLAARQIAAGIHGLVPCGTTGEAPTLTDAEWSDCVRIAVAVSGGKVPVTAGVGTNDTRTTVAKVEAAAALGASHGLLVFPYYNKPNKAGLTAHVQAAAAVGLPLVLYHVPGRTGQLVPAAFVAELTEIPGVVGVKEATGDLRYGGDLLAATQAAVLSGDDFTFLPLLSLGGTGVISVLSNVAPAHTCLVYEAYMDSDPRSAAMAMGGLWELTSFLFRDTNPVPCKAALASLGLCGPTVRGPLAPYDGPDPRPILEALGL